MGGPTPRFGPSSPTPPTPAGGCGPSSDAMKSSSTSTTSPPAASPGCAGSPPISGSKARPPTSRSSTPTRPPPSPDVSAALRDTPRRGTPPTPTSCAASCAAGSAGANSKAPPGHPARQAASHASSTAASSDPPAPSRRARPPQDRLRPRGRHRPEARRLARQHHHPRGPRRRPDTAGRRRHPGRRRQGQDRRLRPAHRTTHGVRRRWHAPRMDRGPGRQAPRRTRPDRTITPRPPRLQAAHPGRDRRHRRHPRRPHQHPPERQPNRPGRRLPATRHQPELQPDRQPDPCHRRPRASAVVSKGGLEPPRPCGHQALNLARLPIPPLRRAAVMSHDSGEDGNAPRGPSSEPIEGLAQVVDQIVGRLEADAEADEVGGTSLVDPATMAWVMRPGCSIRLSTAPRLSARVKSRVARRTPRGPPPPRRQGEADHAAEGPHLPAGDGRARDGPASDG